MAGIQTTQVSLWIPPVSGMTDRQSGCCERQVSANLF
jgi:hypothetical protein